MTIQEIKIRTSETSPYFFSADTLKFFGQRLSSFKVKKQSDGRYKISAPIHDHRGTYMGETIRFFNPDNNNLETK